MDDYIISLYNDKKEKKNYRIDGYFNCGGCGYIYKLDDNKCLKLFSDNLFFSPTVLRIIRKLNLDNFYKIYDLLYDENNHFSGYTMKYYKSEDIDILAMPTNYTLENLYRIHNSFKALTNRHINAFDCNSDNIIMDNKNITVIDSDIYYIDDEISKEELALDNDKILMDLFKSLYYEKLRILGYTLIDCEYMLGELFDENKGLSNTEKRLVKYKYPLDYINKEF